jgi:hypothetical protein
VQLHLVGMGDVADVSEVHTGSIIRTEFDLEVRSSIYFRNAGDISHIHTA